MRDAAALYRDALLQLPQTAPARTYLRERDLDGETAEAFGIGYAPDAWETLLRWAQKRKVSTKILESAGLVIRSDDASRKQPFYDRFRNRIMFPIHDELGRVVAFSGRALPGADTTTAKYVNSPETPLFRKSRILYALDRARRAIVGARTAILCEGQIDCIRCHCAGLVNTIASQGTAITEDHAHLLRRYADEVVLVLDSDTAGQNAALRAAEALLGAGLSLRIAALPQGEDPDAMIRRQGVDAFRALIEQARSVLDFHIDVLAAREDLRTEAGLLRATRAILDTVRQASGAVQRDRMLQQAAARLNISENALRQDFYTLYGARAPAAAARPEPPAAPAPKRPMEEVALAELLAAHEEVKPLVRQYLPPDQIADPVCRTLVERQLAGRNEDLVSRLDGDDEAVQRLVAQVQAAPSKAAHSEIGPECAAQDLILLIRRRALERRRRDVTQQMAQADDATRSRLQMEKSQLGIDIHTLQQGWDKALPLLNLD